MLQFLLRFRRKQLPVFILAFILFFANESTAQFFQGVYGGINADYASGRALVVTPSGEFIFAGGTKNPGITSIEAPCLWKVDQNGNLLWMKTYDGIAGNTDQIYNIALAANGDVLMVGYSTSYTNGNRDGYFARINPSNGNVILFTHFGSFGTEEIFDILPTPDNGCFVSGFSALGAGSTDAYVMRLDAAGVMQYARVVGGFNYDNSYTVVANNAASIYITGGVQSYGQLNNVYVMKMDATTGIVTGGPLVIFGTGDEWAADALPANNSPQKGVYLVGSTNSYGAGSNDIFMARIDSTCGLTWFKTYGGLQSDDPSQIIQLADGNMLVTGTTASYGAGATDMFLMKVDPAGNMIWFKTYGCTGIEYGASVLQLPSSNLALLGTTFSYGAGDADVFLMVTPAEDSVTCNMQFFTPVVLTHFPTIQVGGNEASANTPATVATPTTLTFNFTPGTICSPPLIVTATATPDCTSGTATASVTGGNSPYNYLWSSGQTTAVVPNLAAGTYTVTVTGSVGACVFRTDSDSATVTVNYNPVPVAVISSNAINGSFYFSGQNAELCFSETGSTGYDTLSWFINGVPTGATSCVTINDSTVGPVCATLYVVNTFGCPDTATICAEIIHSDYTIPNIFTPNGDATNDAFIISTNGIKELHCDIYDRWGVLIYSWDGITGKWDGKSLNGEFVSDGVYYFTARLADYQEKVYNENGFVQLIRAK